MAKKYIFAHHLGHNVRVGGCAVSRVPHFSLRFEHVVDESVAPTPPSSTNFAANATASLSRMFGNDQLGDCVCAGRAHRIGLLTGAAGAVFVYTDEQVIAEYERIGGYVPGDASTDQGCDPVVSANDGVHTGYADGSKDLGWVSVDAAKQAQVKLAFWLVENLDLSMALPDEWVDAQMPQKNGDVWDVAGAPNPENGHNVEVVDYNDRGVIVCTWGLLVLVTWAALAKYGVQSAGGMLIAHVNADQIAKATQKAPNGCDWSTVVTFFDKSLGGNVPLPSPPPAPTPPVPAPPPSAVPTLLEAKGWARDGLAKGPALLTRAHAERLAESGLTAGWPKP